MSKHIVIGKGERCKRCGNIMERRKHPTIDYNKMKAKHYFTEWDACVCGMIQHYEQFKILNPKKAALSEVKN